MTGIFQKYFVNPVVEKTGYNPVNTLVYGILLVIGAYALFKFLKYLKFKVDARLLNASIPFVLAVSVWHALTDAGIYPYGFWTTTPGLYIPVLLIFFPLITLAKQTEKWFKWRYEYVYAGGGSALLLSQLAIYLFIARSSFNLDAFNLVLLYTALASAPLLVISRYWKKIRGLNLFMLLAHMFDASVTHVSLSYYNYFEQHVIPNIIFRIFNTSASFYAWKLLVLGAVIYFLDKDRRNGELNNFIKIVFIIYGLATGVRGLLRLTLGV